MTTVKELIEQLRQLPPTDYISVDHTDIFEDDIEWKYCYSEMSLCHSPKKKLIDDGFTDDEFLHKDIQISTVRKIFRKN